jgi:hypothetical protein
MVCLSRHVNIMLLLLLLLLLSLLLLLLLQVETRACFEALDDVLSVPGIDCAFLGEQPTAQRCSIALRHHIVMYSAVTPFLGFARHICCTRASFANAISQHLARPYVHQSTCRMC